MMKKQKNSMRKLALKMESMLILALEDKDD
jgi:hypothetical protein